MALMMVLHIHRSYVTLAFLSSTAFCLDVSASPAWGYLSLSFSICFISDRASIRRKYYPGYFNIDVDIPRRFRFAGLSGGDDVGAEAGIILHHDETGERHEPPGCKSQKLSPRGHHRLRYRLPAVGNMESQVSKKASSCYLVQGSHCSYISYF